MATAKRKIILYLLTLGGLSSQIFGADTTTMLMPNSSVTKSVIYKGNLWIALDGRGGGVLEYDVHLRKFYKRNSGFGRLNTITDMTLHKGELYVCHKFDGVFRYDTLGKSWMNITPPGIVRDSNFFAIEGKGNTLITGDWNGYFHTSIDKGKTWVSNPIDYHTPGINTICKVEGGWLIGTANSYLYRINDNNFSSDRILVTVRGPMPEGFVMIKNVHGSLYACNYRESIMRSDDKGDTWYKWSNNKDLNRANNLFWVGQLLINIVNKGLFTTTDGINIAPIYDKLFGEELVNRVDVFGDLKLICTPERVVVVDLSN